MKKIIYFIFAVALLMSCAEAPKKMEVSVQNPNNFDRISDMVELSVIDLKTKFMAPDTVSYLVTNAKGEVVTSQLTSDGKLIFQAGVKAGETVAYSIRTAPKQEYKAQTYGRFITERKDDFAWENDRVAFRIYGPALVAIDGPSNGIDIWYKRTSEMVIDKWYKGDIAGEASYHNDNGEGLDDYKVGRTLGAGAMAPYVGDKLWLNENFASQEILDNGPLRTTFKLTYKDLDVDGKAVSESRMFSIDAGSQLSKITQEYGTAEYLPVAAGIVKRESGDSIIVSADKSYLVYMEPESKKAQGVYVALVFPQGFEKSTVDSYKVPNAKTKKDDTFDHVLAHTTYQPNSPVTYYTGYGWNKNGFANEAAFQQYLENFVKTLKQPLVVTVK